MFFSALFAMQFWIIWYQVNGSVPVVASLPLAGDWAITLPFEYARPWDVLYFPILMGAFVMLFTARKIMDEGSSAYACLAICAGLGAVLTLVVTLLFGALYSPIAGILAASAALMFTVYWLSSYYLWNSLWASCLGFGLAHGALYGFSFGLIASAALFAVFSSGLVACLYAGEFILLKILR